MLFVFQDIMKDTYSFQMEPDTSHKTHQILPRPLYVNQMPLITDVPPSYYLHGIIRRTQIPDELPNNATPVVKRASAS